MREPAGAILKELLARVPNDLEVAEAYALWSEEVGKSTEALVYLEALAAGLPRDGLPEWRRRCARWALSEVYCA